METEALATHAGLSIDEDTPNSQQTPTTALVVKRSDENRDMLAVLSYVASQLATIARVDEAKEVVDKAEACRVYAKQSQQSLEVQNRCAYVRLSAEHRTGELLQQILPKKQGKKNGGRPPKGSPTVTLSSLGITPNQSSRWQTLAQVPRTEIEHWWHACDEHKEELTTAYAMRQVSAFVATAPEGDPATLAAEAAFRSLRDRTVRFTKFVQQSDDATKIVNDRGKLTEWHVRTMRDALDECRTAIHDRHEWMHRRLGTMAGAHEDDLIASNPSSVETTETLSPDRTLRVLTCVPQQRYSFGAKLRWAEEQICRQGPNVLVLPQEYHGGLQCELFKGHISDADADGPEKVAYAPEEITGPYEALARRYGVGITVGAVIDCPVIGERRERVYVIDPEKGVTGYVDKTMLPAYDHIDAKGRTRISPETDFEKRAVAFDLCGARVSILFCWEAHSNFLWHAITRAQPDFVITMIKFGVRGSPKKVKIDGESCVDGFNIGDDGGWIERLRMAAKWDVACPILCSTNSWNLAKRVGALAGQILPWEERAVTQGEYPRAERRSTLWQSSGKGNLTEDFVQIDRVDFMYWRYIRDDKHKLIEMSGEWPSSEARAYTMAWKIRRMERRMAGLPRIAALSGPHENALAS